MAPAARLATLPREQAATILCALGWTDKACDALTDNRLECEAFAAAETEEWDDEVIERISMLDRYASDFRAEIRDLVRDDRYFDETRYFEGEI